MYEKNERVKVTDMAAPAALCHLSSALRERFLSFDICKPFVCEFVTFKQAADMPDNNESVLTL